MLIRGASGSGKSSLALALVGLGADLVADDRTILNRRGSDVILDCPPAIAGLIEARGIGLLNAEAHGPVPLVAVVDLDTEEQDRLPPQREATVLGLRFPLVHKVSNPHFPAQILHYLRYGRRE